MTSPAPFSLSVFTQCYDSARLYQIVSLYNPFTNSTFHSLHATPCAGSDKINAPSTAVYEMVPIVTDGIIPHHRHNIMPTMVIPGNTEVMHFGGHVGDPIKYEIELHEVSANRVDMDPNFRSVLGEGGIEFYRISDSEGMDKKFMPLKGVFSQGRIDFGIRFHCNPSVDPRLYEGGVHASFGVEMKFQSLEPPNYDVFQPVYLPFRKICPAPTGGWFAGYGSEDDLGHLAGALPLFIYCILLLVNTFNGFQRLTKSMQGEDKGVIIRVTGRLLSAEPFGHRGNGHRGNGLLDSIVLLLGGGIPALIHLNTLTSTNHSMHELYHFMAHFFTLSMGLLSFVVRNVSPETKDLSLPLTMAIVAMLFTLHSQHNPHSASLHKVYSGLILFFSIFRIASHFSCGEGVQQRLRQRRQKKDDDYDDGEDSSDVSAKITATIFSSFCGIWASFTLLVASEDGVQWQIRSSLDVPAVSLLGGAIASATVGGVLIWSKLMCCCCSQNRFINNNRGERTRTRGRITSRKQEYEMVSAGLLEEGEVDEEDSEDSEFVRNVIKEHATNSSADLENRKEDEKKKNSFPM